MFLQDHPPRALLLKRQPIFPNVIEINYQAGHVIDSTTYLVYDGDQWLLIDIGYAARSRRSSS